VRIVAGGFEMTKQIRLHIFLLLFLVLPAAYAQQKGVAEGRVVNGTDPSIIVRSVELDIVELDAGMRIVKTTTTDSSGKFRVDGLPESGQLMIRVSYKDVNYHRQFNPGASGRSAVEIEVYEPTASMKDIEAGESRMAFQLVGDQVRSLESVTFNNKAKPPRTFMNPEGNFRFSKSPGIVEPPEVRVTAPGSAMPLLQAPLESPDAQSYYSLYPLRPGVTSFEIQQVLPYSNHAYAYRKKFYVDVDSMDIAVMPKDMVLSGQGLTRISTDEKQGFSIYRSAPIKAGTEVTWTFSGGTASSMPEAAETDGGSAVESRPDFIRSKALVIGPLLLMGFVLVLWVAFNRMQKDTPTPPGRRTGDLKNRREQLLNAIAELDRNHEMHAISQSEFLRQREESKRQLRRISLLLKM
jgi:hypothetical protein